MNLRGVSLEGCPQRRPPAGPGGPVLSLALVPFQGWAAMKGLLEKEEGPWFRTPKTGIITDEVKHLRRLHLLRRWLLGPRAGGYAREPVSVKTRPAPIAHMRARIPSRWVRWIVAGSLLLAFGPLAWGATRGPVVQAAANPP